MKKIFKGLMALTLVFISVFAIGGCGKDDDPPVTSYTVTEEEWKINFKLTKGQSQVQPVAYNLAQEVTAITSYTLYAEGESAGTEGTSLLKVAPNAMSIEFKVGDTLREDESGTYASSDTLYQTLTRNIMTYFPFGDSYNDFTFDETKNAYVAEELTATMVDDYDPTDVDSIYTKSAEVTFVNGYLNTIKVTLCDENFDEVYASFVFTFSNINNTTVELN